MERSYEYVVNESIRRVTHPEGSRHDYCGRRREAARVKRCNFAFFCSNVVRHLLAEWRFSSVLAASKRALRLWRVAEIFDNRKVILVWHFDKISESIVKLIMSKLQRQGYL